MPSVLSSLSLIASPNGLKDHIHYTIETLRSIPCGEPTMPVSKIVNLMEDIPGVWAEASEGQAGDTDQYPGCKSE